MFCFFFAGRKLKPKQADQCNKDLIKDIRDVTSDWERLKAVLRIRMRMDPELLLGSGSGIKIQSWIRIRNKSFRIRNTG